MSDAPVQRNGFKVEVGAVVIGVCQGAADTNPVVVAAFAIANIVGEVARRPGSDGFGFG